MKLAWNLKRIIYIPVTETPKCILDDADELSWVTRNIIIVVGFWNSEQTDEYQCKQQ
jgi:hypothetical protein